MHNVVFQTFAILIVLAIFCAIRRPYAWLRRKILLPVDLSKITNEPLPLAPKIMAVGSALLFIFGSMLVGLLVRIWIGWGSGGVKLFLAGGNPTHGRGDPIGAFFVVLSVFPGVALWQRMHFLLAPRFPNFAQAALRSYALTRRKKVTRAGDVARS